MSQVLQALGFEPIPPPTRAELDAFWFGLQARLAGLLAEKIPDESTVAMLDYPVHSNTGDHLIMLGTDAWTARQRFRVLGRWHADNFRFPQFPPETIVVCHGGGNVGDLYRYQRHREKVIAAYPRHRIVILPQTIYFRSPERLRQSAEQMSGHADLHLFVRDRRSLEIARAEFPDCHPTLAPDMAAFLYPVEQQLRCQLRPGGQREVFCLCRRDLERTNLANLPALAGHPCLDWDDLNPWQLYFIYGVIGFGFAFGKVYPATWAAAWWHEFCRKRAVRAAQAMNAAQCVIANRLHGHILACLLGIPNLVFDNSYGKNRDYYQAWHAELTFAKLVPTQ